MSVVKPPVVQSAVRDHHRPCPDTADRPRPAWRRRLGRRRLALAAVPAAAATVLAFAGSASAHVTVQADSAVQGSYSKVTFRVPNERDAAGTVKLEVTLPSSEPIASVQTRALPGWKAAVEQAPLPAPVQSHGRTITQAPSRITWTALPGTRIAPGTFEDFEVSMGPLPSDTGQLVFKALQTYDSGEVVRWIDVPAPGAPEPQYPAPTLRLTPEQAPSNGMAAPATTGGVGVSAAPPGGHDSDSTARALGVAGLVVGVLGLATAAFAVIRGARTGTERTP